LERKWIKNFYKECGREVSLAYNVLNQSNNWGVTLLAAILATGFIGAVEINNGQIIFHYPTIIHWFYIILAWIIMVRFFVRSALGLVNMYRWNTLIQASINILSLPKDDPYLKNYKIEFAKKFDAYFIKWKSPIKKRFLIWRNLVLMYFWFFLILLILFIWGLVELEKNYLYWIGISIFMISVIIEGVWFSRWKGFKYEKIDVEDSPSIVDLWTNKITKKRTNPSKEIIMGFCRDGPYKHASTLLENPDVKWMPWNYYSSEVDPNVIADIKSGFHFKGKKVFFASWTKSFKGKSEIIRLGEIDYIRIKGNCLHSTIKLLEKDLKNKIKIKIKNPKIYCFYHE